MNTAETKDNPDAPTERKPFIPQVIIGGKDGGGDGFGNGPDWLRDLPVGSVFFAQDKQAVNSREDKYFAIQGPFMVSYRTPNGRGTVMALESPTGQQAMISVDSLRFSSRYSCFDILNFGDGKPLTKDQFNNEEETPTEGDTEDGSERPVQP